MAGLVHKLVRIRSISRSIKTLCVNSTSSIPDMSVCWQVYGWWWTLCRTSRGWSTRGSRRAPSRPPRPTSTGTTTCGSRAASTVPITLTTGSVASYRAGAKLLLSCVCRGRRPSRGGGTNIRFCQFFAKKKKKSGEQILIGAGKGACNRAAPVGPPISYVQIERHFI